mmetsp:Transcript_5317/g.12255  ORF Transcript_5317/g.12255 Transcript_5317/m.12255 type:complete len:284 (+) Transcript_5317:218-1069(+)
MAPRRGSTTIAHALHHHRRRHRRYRRRPRRPRCPLGTAASMSAAWPSFGAGPANTAPKRTCGSSRTGDIPARRILKVQRCADRFCTSALSTFTSTCVSRCPRRHSRSQAMGEPSAKSSTPRAPRRRLRRLRRRRPSTSTASLISSWWARARAARLLSPTCSRRRPRLRSSCSPTGMIRVPSSPSTRSTRPSPTDSSALSSASSQTRAARAPNGSRRGAPAATTSTTAPSTRFLHSASSKRRSAAMALPHARCNGSPTPNRRASSPTRRASATTATPPTLRPTT